MCVQFQTLIKQKYSYKKTHRKKQIKRRKFRKSKPVNGLNDLGCANSISHMP